METLFFCKMTVLSTLADNTEKFLRLFYLVLPSRTTFDRLEDVPDYIAEAIPFFVMTMGLEVGLYLFKKGAFSQSKGKIRLNDAITSINQGSVQQLSRFVVRGVELSSYIYVWNHFRVYPLESKSLSTWILTFLACDCAYYWFHRMAHEINLFWAAHVVHHSSEYYNQTTATRQSVFQQFFSWPFYLPAALFIPPEMFAVHKQLVTLYQYWIHTELVPELGFLEYIINTPSAHRVHHGRNPYCIDKNYAGTLIIWDRMFGTYQRETEPIAYGITHPINTFDTMEIQTHQFQSIFQRVCSTPGFLNKLKVMFYGPGWEPGTQRLGDPQKIPHIDTKNVPDKYDPGMSTDTAIYVLTHSLVSVGMMDAALMNTIPSVPPHWIALWTTFGIFSMGHLFNRKRWAWYLEFSRNALGLALVPILLSKQKKLSIFLQVVYGTGTLYLGSRIASQKAKLV
jgi:alkylglycerol monooxygenase